MSIDAGDVAAIAIGIGNISVWMKLIYDARKNGKNPKPCGLHLPMAERLRAIESEKDGLIRQFETLHGENRQDHLQLSSEIKILSANVASASSAASSAAAIAAQAVSSNHKVR